MDRTIGLSKFHNPNEAFFLAITPRPDADLFEDVRHHIAVRGCRKCDPGEPIIKPRAMTLEEVREKLFDGFREFHHGKMEPLPSMPE